MRQYAWYNPEFNIIALQSIIEDCMIAFEYAPVDLYDTYVVLGRPEDEDVTGRLLWIPLGEL
jgi:hypothetical protein